MNLYKYYSFDENNYNINGLKNQEIYLADPLLFDNPTEKEPNSIRIEFKDKKDLEEARDRFFKKAKDSYWDQLNEMPIAQLEVLMKSKCKGQVRKDLRNSGVTCFSEEDLDKEMWSSYSEDHSGFVIEYDKENPFFESCYNVNYSDTNPVITGPMIGNEEPGAPKLVNSILHSKGEKWAYEKEWRGLHKEKSQTLNYDPTMITGVILGKDCSTENEKLIKTILKDSALKHISLYKTKATPNSDKLSKVKLSA